MTCRKNNTFLPRRPEISSCLIFRLNELRLGAILSVLFGFDQMYGPEESDGMFPIWAYWTVYYLEISKSQFLRFFSLIF